MRCVYCNQEICYTLVDFDGNEHCPECQAVLVVPTPRCKVCGRKLKTAESKRIGMGPTCYHRYIMMLKSSRQRKLF